VSLAEDQHPVGDLGPDGQLSLDPQNSRMVILI
jgi:hypothetical protein